MLDTNKQLGALRKTMMDDTAEKIQMIRKLEAELAEKTDIETRRTDSNAQLVVNIDRLAAQNFPVRTCQNFIPQALVDPTQFIR